MAIDNWTKFPLIEPQTDLKCGKVYGTMPTTIIPGTSEMVIFEKGVRKTKYPTFECILFRNRKNVEFELLYFRQFVSNRQKYCEGE